MEVLLLEFTDQQGWEIKNFFHQAARRIFQQDFINDGQADRNQLPQTTVVYVLKAVLTYKGFENCWNLGKLFTIKLFSGITFSFCCHIVILNSLCRVVDEFSQCDLKHAIGQGRNYLINSKRFICVRQSGGKRLKNLPKKIMKHYE